MSEGASRERRGACCVCACVKIKSAADLCFYMATWALGLRSPLGGVRGSVLRQSGRGFGPRLRATLATRPFRASASAARFGFGLRRSPLPFRPGLRVTRHAARAPGPLPSPLRHQTPPHRIDARSGGSEASARCRCMCSGEWPETIVSLKDCELLRPHAASRRCRPPHATRRASPLPPWAGRHQAVTHVQGPRSRHKVSLSPAILSLQ